MSESRLLTGIGVSPGVAVGPALVLQWDLPEVPHRDVPEDRVEKEVARLHEALAAVRGHLEALRRRAEERVGPEEARIFDAQVLMLEDAEFVAAVERLIRDHQLSAERAFEFKALELRALWAQATNERLRQRIADLSGIQVRVLRHLLGQPVDPILASPDGRPVVVFTRELTPGLTVQFDAEHVVGFASEEGTRTSHAAILAHSLGIPCVMGLVGGLAHVRTGVEVVLDGTHGTVRLNPTRAELREVRAQERRRRALERQLELVLDQPATTRDGVTVTLRGNLDLPEELEAAVQHRAEGVGLMRTEFLLVGRTELPAEDEQARYFERVARRFAGHPVLVRTFDLGGDKFPAPFRSTHEPNPFLGWRAIRVCLDQPEMFRVQIRAALRARLSGDIQLLLPLVTQVDEVEQTREYVAAAVDELERRGVPSAPDLPIGVMVETPAAVVLADELAARSDFLSVGSNDLTQYTLAVDRGNARLADRFTPFHPAVVRMLKWVCDAGERAGKPASVCGEMASEPLAAFLLLGLGYRTLSVAPPALPLLRWGVRQIDRRAATLAAQEALAAATTTEVTAILEAALSQHVDLRWLEAGRLPKGKRATSLKA
ncbi:MAG: phosphoenolpyruvate--protein phosphotransferase [Gemmatimonadetes bacterium]|nr:phosphoenolpyruvate--protein phosphotransferase [Gemmatimonadota bacterium]